MQLAVKLFREWHKWKIETTILDDQELNVFNDIDGMSKSDLNFVLRKFIFETRKQNKERYPLTTLYDIFAMLNYYVQNKLKRSWSLFKDTDFNNQENVLKL